MSARSFPQQTLRTPAVLRTLVGLLAIFILAQTLGWMHRAVHGSGEPLRAAVVEQVGEHRVASTLASAEEACDVRGWLSQLFSSHQHASDCRLFDVMTQPGVDTVASIHLAAPVPLGPPQASSRAGFVARWRAQFDARGPPLFR